MPATSDIRSASSASLSVVIPAKAGIQGPHDRDSAARTWIPAFAGMTAGETELFERTFSPLHSLIRHLLVIAPRRQRVVALDLEMGADALQHAGQQDGGQEGADRGRDAGQLQVLLRNELLRENLAHFPIDAPDFHEREHDRQREEGTQVLS